MITGICKKAGHRLRELDSHNLVPILLTTFTVILPRIFSIPISDLSTEQVVEESSMPCDDIKIQETREEEVLETLEIHEPLEIQETEATAQDEPATRDDTEAETAASGASPEAASAAGDSLIASPSQDFSPSLSTAGIQCYGLMAQPLFYSE